jgi:hypothetical protein
MVCDEKASDHLLVIPLYFYLNLSLYAFNPFDTFSRPSANLRMRIIDRANNNHDNGRCVALELGLACICSEESQRLI